MNSRREFLKGSATGGIAAATLAAFPPSIRRALAIPAFSETGSIKDVKHVVLLMMENRSFDGYFGTFKGVRGYGDRFAIPTPNGKNIFYQTYTKTTPPSTFTPYHLDETKGNAQRAGGTPHTWSDAQAAWDHGRMYKWPDAKNQLSMGYYDTAEVPFQRALAEAFTLCDHYHCGMHTGTIANRLFYWSGTNGPNGISPIDGSSVAVATLNNQFNGGNDIGPSSEGWTWTTYADRLEKAGVSWKVYQSLIDNFGCNEMMSFRHWRAAIEQMPPERRPVFVPSTDITQPVNLAGPFYDPAIDDKLSPLAKGFGNTMPYGFLETLRDDIANDTLPAVSWIIPPSAYSEHPGPSSPAKGGWYMQEVLDALTANPDVWSKTVLLINFDENDGFFDHLPSPAVPSINPDGSAAGKTTLSDSDLAVEYHNYKPATTNQPASDGRPYGPGPRVPMWVVSPWSRGGWVNSQVFDHTSTLLFLEKRFGVVEEQISKYRRAICGDLTSAFNFAFPNTERLPTLAGRKTKSEADTLTANQQALPKITPPTDAIVPAQATGVRPSRALPYELQATAYVEAGKGTVKLVFANSGYAGAVFHVYDNLHLDQIPRRYAVEPGKVLEDEWTVPDANNGLYDLWVLGPNGFHRHFKGFLQRVRMSNASNPEIGVSYDAQGGGLILQLRNDGTGAVRFTVKSNKIYRPLIAFSEPKAGPFPSRGTSWDLTVPAHRPVALYWKLETTGGWYDFAVTSDFDSTFQRRLAGRVETGRHSVSDPAMGLTDSF
ncbi:phosphocholine-specific phospholipase C [Beijerinckia indica]|uniref:phospholipase C n=1 Tax=Beijerinckia indica subsp. indica (strain ATCC 9039 / DSM 1715 / NCIMB 8712) TaxID=395963 RepID=B2IC68_BEII9|nr:phospholipase C, phosphocholine-specific [Beijerinckia indica]ACB96665.1 phospholipase C, phosphocholine-specific [Beijerinckia indica subsp. indica ATCC 9039]